MGKAILRTALKSFLGVVVVGTIINLVASMLFEWRFPAFFGHIQDATVAVWRWLGTPVPIWAWALSFAALVYCFGPWERPVLFRRPLHTYPDDIVGILTAWIGHY